MIPVLVVGVTLGVWFPQVLNGVGYGELSHNAYLQDDYRLRRMAFGLHRVEKQGQSYVYLTPPLLPLPAPS